MADIAEGRLRKPVAHLFLILAHQPAVVAGNGIVATLGVGTLQPLIAQLTAFLQLLATLQFLDTIHQIVRMLMVDHREEGVAIDTLLLVIAVLHRTDFRIIPQLAIHMHLGRIIVLQPHTVQFLFVYGLQEKERLTVITYGRALKSPEHPAVSCLCGITQLGSPLLGLVDIIKRGVVHKGLVELIESESQLEFILWRYGLDILLALLFYLRFVFRHVFGRVVYRLVNLLKNRLYIIFLGRCR